MHLSEGEIHAYHDRQLDPAAARRAGEHLAVCAECHARAENAFAQRQRIELHLQALDDAASCPTPAAARIKLSMRLQQDYDQKERQPMLKQLSSRISRPAWAGLALIAVLAVALAFPQVRAVANSFLQLFRVEQVRLLPVDMEALSEEMESSQNLEALFTDSVAVEQSGERREVTTFDEAAALAGFPLRQLTGAEGSTRFMVEPAGTMTFKVDLEMARSALREMGRDEIQLPDSLEGAVVKVEAPTSVTALIGECGKIERQDPDMPATEPAEPQACTVFTQAPSPAISAPPEMDLEQMGQLYLQVLGMSEEEARLYAASVDWATTLVMPVPQSGGEYEEVTVDGVQGLFHKTIHYNTEDYALMWVKDGIVYLLNGVGSRSDALDLVASLK